MAEISSLDVPPIFLFLTETFIFDDEVEHYNINNYVVHANCNNSYKSGGVIAYARSNLKCHFSNYSFKSCDILKIDTK